MIADALMAVLGVLDEPTAAQVEIMVHGEAYERPEARTALLSLSYDYARVSAQCVAAGLPDLGRVLSQIDTHLTRLADKTRGTGSDYVELIRLTQRLELEMSNAETAHGITL